MAFLSLFFSHKSVTSESCTNTTIATVLQTTQSRRWQKGIYIYILDFRHEIGIICRCVFRASLRLGNVVEYLVTVPSLVQKFVKRHHRLLHHRYTLLHRHGNSQRRPRDDHHGITCRHAAAQLSEIVINDTRIRSACPTRLCPVTLPIRPFIIPIMESIVLITIFTIRIIICTIRIIIYITRIKRIPIIRRAQDIILRKEQTVLQLQMLDKLVFPVQELLLAENRSGILRRQVIEFLANCTACTHQPEHTRLHTRVR